MTKCAQCRPSGKCLDHARKPADLSLYHQGAWTYLEMLKAVRSRPALRPYLDPDMFSRSLGWSQTRRSRGYTEDQAEEFLKGFAAARKIKEGT